MNTSTVTVTRGELDYDDGKALVAKYVDLKVKAFVREFVENDIDGFLSIDTMQSYKITIRDAVEMHTEFNIVAVEEEAWEQIDRLREIDRQDAWDLLELAN